MYRIDTLDSINRTVSPDFGFSRVFYRDEDMHPVYVIELDGATPLIPDFEDFIVFVSAFGSLIGDSRFLAQADTDDNGKIAFSDFLNFADSFGRKSQLPAIYLGHGFECDD